MVYREISNKIRWQNSTCAKSQSSFFHISQGERRLLTWNAGIHRAWRCRTLDVRVNVIDRDRFIFLTNLGDFVNSYTQHFGDGQILEGLQKGTTKRSHINSVLTEASRLCFRSSPWLCRGGRRWWWASVTCSIIKGKSRAGGPGDITTSKWP